MIWLYILIPIIVVSAGPIFFAQKSGMKMPCSSENVINVRSGGEAEPVEHLWE
jgi:hypothetical protein